MPESEPLTPRPSAAATNLRSLAGISKRVLDILLSGLAIVLLAIPMLVISILVKLDSPGPALFRSRRIGRNGEPFDMLKFRTMVAGADERREGPPTPERRTGRPVQDAA